MLKNKQLWGITTFFNPEKYKSKYRNYKKFRKSSDKQGLNLIVVECVFGDADFELLDKDAEIVVRVRCNSILWQKERLLNIALDHLPEECINVAWLDADVIFLNDNWINETNELLEKYKVVQLFETAVRLNKDQEFTKLEDFPEGKNNGQKQIGYMYKMMNDINVDYYPASGLAWAIKRQVIEKIKFYDKMILGSGDTVMLRSFFEPEDAIKKSLSTLKLEEDILQWIKKTNQIINRQIYYTQGTILHLFHGKMKNRFYGDRYFLIRKHNFDPNKDLILNKDGCWEWNTKNKKMIKSVEKYFLMRNEDAKKNIIYFFILIQHLKIYIFVFLKKFIPFSLKISKKIMPKLYARINVLYNKKKRGEWDQVQIDSGLIKEKPDFSKGLLPNTSPRFYGANTKTSFYGSDHTGDKIYNFNSLGYRCEEFNKDAKYALYIAGNSHTFGTGLNWEETWGFNFKELFKEKFNIGDENINLMNFSVGAVSNSYLIRTIITNCNFQKPDLLICEFSYKKNKEFLFEKDSQIFCPSLPKTDLSLLKHPLMSDMNLHIDTLKDILLLQYYCKANNIKYIFTWPDIHLLQNLQEKLIPTHRFLFEEIDFSFFLENRIHDIQIDYAADYNKNTQKGHFGPRTHKIWAQMLFDKYLKLYKS